MRSVHSHIGALVQALYPLLRASQKLSMAALLACVLGFSTLAWADEDVPVQESVGQTAGKGVAEVTQKEESEIPAGLLVADNANAVDPRQTPDNSFLYDTSIVELSNTDSSFQGNTVQVTGEVIGDAIRAEQDSDKHWITMESIEEDADNSISVLIDDSYLDLIDTYGMFGKRGTILQVRGTFYLTCPSHEGIMDIHAESVKLIERGADLGTPFDIDLFTPGIAFAVLGLLLTLVYSRLRERER